MNLYVFDIHGTLLNEGYEINSILLNKIKSLINNGDKIALASGHHWNRIEPLSKKYGIPFIGIANTGAQVHYPEFKKIEVYSKVDPKVTYKFVENAKKIECFIYLHTKDHSYISIYNSTYEKLNKLAVPVYESELVSNEKIEDLIANNDITQISIKTYEKNIENVYQNIKKTASGHRLEKIMNLFVDCGSIKTSKGTGVKEVAKKYNILNENIFVFGDDINDLSMINTNKNSIAMGNAIPTIKENATYVTTSNDENGILKFISDYEIRKNNLQKIKNIYCITDSNDPQKRDLIQQAREFVNAGASVVQYRNKKASYDEKIKDLREIKKIVHKKNAILIVNDDYKLAIEVDSDGLHIGQDDGDVKAIRKKIPNKMILGLSISNVSELNESSSLPVDYLGVGAIFPTSTKKDVKIVSSNDLEKISKSKIKKVAIGGITNVNIMSIKKYEFDAFCIIKDLLTSQNMNEYIGEIQKKISKKGKANENPEK